MTRKSIVDHKANSLCLEFKKKTLVNFLVFSVSIRGDYVKNVTYSFVSLGYWPCAGSFGFFLLWLSLSD